MADDTQELPLEPAGGRASEPPKPRAFSPLAARMRPRALSEVVGHANILGEGCLLPRLVAADNFGSLIFYGPPGCGKTTLANVIAAQTRSRFVKINAVLSNAAQLRDELAEALTERGVSVVHDREIYDYPSYTGSYNRSGAAVEAYLAQYPGIAVVIDLHRDALGDGEVVYKTVAELDGAASSQLMMLVGTGESGLYHPNWEQNLRLALYLQQAVNERFPTLARPISLVKERYNQHLSTGMFILEVGSSGNSLQEALTAVRLYAEAVAPALLKLAG